MLNDCLENAYKSYVQNWANSCKSVADRVSKEIINCASGILTQKDCEDIWGKPDCRPNCLLPRHIGESLNSYYKELKDKCFKLYPVK